MTAVICAIVKYEELYLDEWIRYHKHIGFDHIYLFDNSDEYTLKGWEQKYPGFLEVTHFPGKCLQEYAYNTFLKLFKGVHTWCAFIDVDEFIVLRKHKNVKDLLKEHCKSGALALNWIMFGSSGHKSYSNKPVRKRFTWRHAEVNDHVKSIVHIPSTSRMFVHHCVVHEGTLHDTSGNFVHNHFNHAKVEDVAVVHHYVCKSYGEFVAKVERGRADIVEKRDLNEFQHFDHNDVEDVSAWNAYPY